jgi:hypothetical protein
MTKLFIVYIGGRIRGCHIEMHDVRFVVGTSIDDTLDALREEWIGDKHTLHIDAWIELSSADGYQISLSQEMPRSDSARDRDLDAPKLYFINMGGYDAERFTELHEVGFVVASSPQSAKAKAKKRLLVGTESQHKDDLFDVDDCIALEECGGYRIHLTPTDKTKAFKPDWFGYRVIGQ